MSDQPIDSEPTTSAPVLDAELRELLLEMLDRTRQVSEILGNLRQWRPDERTRRLLELEARITELEAELRSIEAVGYVAVSIYLADESIHQQVEVAVERWLATADVSVDERQEPVIRSWFRLMAASLKKAVKTPTGQQALLTATHVAESHLVHAQDAYVTSTLLQNVGPVLQALQPTKDAVVRAGALLIVKVDWVVQVHQLTAAQQAILDHQPHLAASPGAVIVLLGASEPVFSEDTERSATPQVSTDTAGTKATE